MEPISIDIQYSAEDLQKAYLLNNKIYYPIRSRILLFIGILIVFLGCFCLLLNFISLQEGWWLDSQPWLFIVYGVIFIGYHFWKMKRMGIRMYKRMPDFQLPYNILISEKSITAKGTSISSEVIWEHYKNAIITEEFVLLYINPFKFSIYPKRFFKNEEFTRLKELVIKNVKEVTQK